MIDIHDAELDARPTEQELCEHKEIEQREEFYGLQPTQLHTYFACADCGTTDLPEPDWDLMREGK